MKVEPITLEGEFVRMEPLSLAHVPDLTSVGTDGELWLWTKDLVRNEAEMRAYVADALAMQAGGNALPFATVERASGRAIGCTRMFEINHLDRNLEIGYTWIAPAWQRTVINTEAKYLMLRHAFEVLGCIRVSLKTDSLNEKSRRAIRRLGAKEEGTFRNHMVMREGRYRHSVYHSIIDSEWRAIKLELERRLYPDGPRSSPVDGLARD
jgi:RimJ/RimL family protein N-acetyltransferase